MIESDRSFTPSSLQHGAISPPLQLSVKNKFALSGGTVNAGARVFICGSRGSSLGAAAGVVERAITELVSAITKEAIIIIGGEPTGADRYAENAAIARGWIRVEFSLSQAVNLLYNTVRHPEAKGKIFVVPVKDRDWSKHGRQAGPIRNEVMIDALDSKTDRAFAFTPSEITPGTKNAIAHLCKRGIPVQVFQEGSTDFRAPDYDAIEALATYCQANKITYRTSKHSFTGFVAECLFADGQKGAEFHNFLIEQQGIYLPHIAARTKLNGIAYSVPVNERLDAGVSDDSPAVKQLNLFAIDDPVNSTDQRSVSSD